MFRRVVRSERELGKGAEYGKPVDGNPAFIVFRNPTRATHRRQR